MATTSPELGIRKAETSRPIGVTVISILLGIGGVLLVVGGGIALVGSIQGWSVAANRPIFNQMVGSLSLTLGVLGIVLTIGMWQLRNWAREVTLVLLGIAAAVMVVSLIVRLLAETKGVSSWNVVTLVLSAIFALVIVYLLRPEIASVFGGNYVMPYILLIISVLPILIGYAWVIIATFSYRTEGLLPINAEGNVGGFTLANWSFLKDPAIWRVTLNSFLIAMGMVIGVGFVSSLAAYSLSRMNFSGRKGFLSMTLILHAFPSVTLLIAIFFVLRFISGLPGLGSLFGYNTVGGVALVMVALELPLGIWLMKGFFDNLSWDMERAALIDGASRFRVWWEIIIPQIKPGLAALAIFTFLSGWSAFLIPFTYTVGTKVANLPVFLNQLMSDTAPTNWNAIAAVGLFQLVPVLIFFIFTQEMLLNIYSGGAKGGT
jgi:inositol-phosphate transport system permease protein